MSETVLQYANRFGNVAAMKLTDRLIELGGTGKIDCPVIAATAKKAGCSHRTLYMISLGHKRASASLAKRIEIAAGGAITRAELRPDVFDAPPKNRKAA
jgi:hypothetical protein